MYTHKNHGPLCVSLVIVFPLSKFSVISSFATPSSFWLHKYFDTSISLFVSIITLADCDFLYVAFSLGVIVTFRGDLSIVTSNAVSDTLPIVPTLFTALAFI